MLNRTVRRCIWYNDKYLIDEIQDEKYTDIYGNPIESGGYWYFVGGSLRFELKEWNTSNIILKSKNLLEIAKKIEEL